MLPLDRYANVRECALPISRPLLSVGDTVWTYNAGTARNLPDGLEDLTELQIVTLQHPEAIVRRADGAEFRVMCLQIEAALWIEVGGKWLAEFEPAALDAIEGHIRYLESSAPSNLVQRDSIRAQIRHLEFVLRRNGR